MNQSVYQFRMDRARTEMAKQGIDCLMVVPSSDMKYLCGYPLGGDERLLVLVLTHDAEPFILANQLYELQMPGDAVTDYIFWKDGEDPVAMLKEVLQKKNVKAHRIAVSAAMPAMFLLQIMAVLSQMEFVNAGSIISALRVYKDAQEKEYMIKAVQASDRALTECMRHGRQWLGRTEEELMDELIRCMKAEGLSAPGGIAAAGANAAEPHHMGDRTIIREGDCVLLDFGGAYQHYMSDTTRTFFMGEPDPEAREVYQIVLEANAAGEEAAKAGNPLCAVDQAARAVIERYGYGAYFTHRTGHGIGIDCHEGPAASGVETTLIRPGMAFTCEPGIYLPGRFGVRIEDQIIMNEDGTPMILQKYPKDMIIL